MKNLNRVFIPPEYISYLVAIRDAKKASPIRVGTVMDHKSILTTGMSKIDARYKMFEDAVARRKLETLRQSRPMKSIGDSLRSCYEIDTKGVRRLKAAIRAAQGAGALKYCPCCGTTGVSTHDHYLPSSLFPEFAVHPLNLVPCCSTCNTTKGDGWLDTNGQRLYLHAYSDLFPADVFLRVELKTSTLMRGVGAAFSIVRPTTV